MLNYFQEVRDGENVYSIDNVRCKIRWNEPDAQHFMNWLSAIELDYEDKDYRHYMSSKLFTYRHMFTLCMGTSSVTVGIDFIDSKRTGSIVGFLDFNPNKVGNDYRFIKLFNKLRDTCKELLCVRWDLAIDIPGDREYFRLEKDGRNYETIRSHTGFTEYLGVRNEEGRVKLYDKTKESKLSSPVTRLEVTIGGDVPFNMVGFPRVLGIVKQIGIDANINLAKTDLVLYRLLLQCDNMMDEFKQLGRDKQKKLKPYLFAEDTAFKPSSVCYSKLLSQIRDYEIHYVK